uniref:Uncharacterized protein n=1 Tax=Rhizophora mucronata TaxID=61149 RepID=A0A2P2N8E5_RHIMU
MCLAILSECYAKILLMLKLSLAIIFLEEDKPRSKGPKDSVHLIPDKPRLLSSLYTWEQRDKSTSDS